MLQRDERGRVKSGVLNPLGRAAGSKTSLQLANEATLQASGPEILQAAIQRALKGSDALLSKLVDKLVPPATKVLDLAAIPELQRGSDATAAILACVEALKRGELTAGDLAVLVKAFGLMKPSLAGLKAERMFEELDV